VFIVIFLLLTSYLTFFEAGFYERREASLASFFLLHPILYLFLIPAVSMRLWAEERKQGTMELLMTLPISTAQAVAGKYLAAWTFTTIALACTFPLWITVNYLGNPDNGVIIASYIGSFLMAGGYLAIGSCLSAITRNQVIAFVLTITACAMFLLLANGEVMSFLTGLLPERVVDVIASFSFSRRFTSITKGVIEARDVVYFLSLIGTWLAANVLVLEMKRGS
jgi:ABC-2 type transport system permease protein